MGNTRQESPLTEGFLSGLILVGICCVSTVAEPKFMCPKHSEAKQTETSKFGTKEGLLQGSCKENGWFLLKRPKLPDGFQGRSFFFFFNFYLFIYLLFLAVLGLRFSSRAFSSCGEWGPLFITVRRPLTVAASVAAEHRLQTRRLSSCGSRA